MKACALRCAFDNIMFALGLGLFALPYWIVFYVNFFLDLHLKYVRLGMVLKWLLPLALLCNVIGSIIGIASLMKQGQQQGLTIAGLILNILPLLGVGAIVFWWTFIFKM